MKTLWCARPHRQKTTAQSHISHFLISCHTYTGAVYRVKGVIARYCTPVDPRLVLAEASFWWVIALLKAEAGIRTI